MNNIISLVLMLILMCAAFVEAGEGNTFEKKIKLENGKTISINVVLTTKNEYLSNKNKIFWGSDEEFMPKSLIDNLIVYSNDKKILIPYSAFADLSNIMNVNINKDNGGFFVLIEGGEAQYSRYLAYLYFDNEDFLLSRKICSTTFPEDVWEKTQYSFNRSND